jgi:hypothetical protein
MVFVNPIDNLIEVRLCIPTQERRFLQVPVLVYYTSKVKAVGLQSHHDNQLTMTFFRIIL